MFSLPIIFAFIFLIVIAVIDIWRKEIPAIITTSFIIISLMAVGPIGIFSGIIMALFGWLFIELKFFEGGADLKVMAALGALTHTYTAIIAFIAITMVAGILYTFFLKYAVNQKLREAPFTPVFLIPLISLAYMGVI